MGAIVGPGLDALIGEDVDADLQHPLRLLRRRAQRLARRGAGDADFRSSDRSRHERCGDQHQRQGRAVQKSITHR
jgi:hypothetical protein